MAQKYVFLKPREGLTVRDPLTYKALPSTGAKVLLTTHWRRRLSAGDVLEVDAEAVQIQ